ncbi:MAG: hypothetical protein CMJ18_04725 [Phycisphaeraceae bacterium]|nr:hypothetical protein [Phycisphaeraceae bacterium]
MSDDFISRLFDLFSLAQAGAAVLVLGGAAVIAQRAALARRGRARWLGAWMAGICLVVAWWLVVSLPGRSVAALVGGFDEVAGGWWRHALPRAWGLALLVASPLTLLSAAADRRVHLGERDMRRAVRALRVPLAVVTVVGAAFVLAWPRGPDVSTRGGATAAVMSAMLMVLLGTQAAAMIWCLGRRNGRALAVAFALPVAFLVAAIAAVAARIVGAGAILGTFETPDGAGPTGLGALGAWFGQYLAALGLLVAGGAICWRMLPRDLRRLPPGRGHPDLADKGGAAESPEPSPPPVAPVRSAPTMAPAPAPVPDRPAPAVMSAAPAIPAMPGARFGEDAGGGFPSRWHYLLLAVAGSILVHYASLIPLEYEPKSWADGVARFREVTWLKMTIERRADLIANFVLFIPLGFFWMGAFQAGTPRRLHDPLTMLAVWILLGALAVTIEFTQAWFPIRTMSINDMTAETFGALAGILIWFSTGRWVTRRVREIDPVAAGPRARRRCLQFYAAVLVGYTLMPFDLTISPVDLAKKVELGRIVVIPFSRAYGGPLEFWISVVRPVALFMPVGVMIRLGWAPFRPATLLGQGLAVAGFATALEVAQIFVFRATVDPTDVLVATIGGLLGLAAATWLLDDQGAVRLGAGMDDPTRFGLGLALALVYVVPVVLLLWQPMTFNLQWELFAERIALFLNPPFRYYYFSGEWQALTKVSLCVLAFVPFGALLRWGSGVRGRDWSGRLVVLAVTVVVGLLIETGQALIVREAVFVAPSEVLTGAAESLHQARDVTPIDLSKGMKLEKGPIPDVTDLIAYVLGAAFGWMVAGLFLARGGQRAG